MEVNVKFVGDRVYLLLIEKMKGKIVSVEIDMTEDVKKLYKRLGFEVRLI